MSAIHKVKNILKNDLQNEIIYITKNIISNNHLINELNDFEIELIVNINNTSNGYRLIDIKNNKIYIEIDKNVLDIHKN